MDTLVNSLIPLVMGVGGLYLFLHGRREMKRRNREIEASWNSHKKEDPAEL